MIEVIFTLDYEIYGSGEGSLKELVYEPAEKLKAVFTKWKANFVVFIEVAELEIIEASGSDQAIDLIKQQIRDFQKDGFELGLHIHPQWYNACHKDAHWQLDYGEYNLCRLPPDRIDQIIDRSIAYFRKVLGAPSYSPVSFRAGNWLLQPTGTMASALARHGIKIDSSVYKGGLQHQHDLDYRKSGKNGYYWAFSEDVNVPNPHGILIEIPTFTKMVPVWKMFTAKRVGLQQKGSSRAPYRQRRLTRLRDFLRFRHPMKLDYCRLTASEMIRMFDQEMEKDRKDPALFRPLVAIGHTKDLIDLETVDSFLSYLRGNGIPISTFRNVHGKIMERDERA